VNVITLSQLIQIMPSAKLRAVVYYASLCNAMDEFEINTPLRQAMFLAQVAHESCQLLYVRELASGVAYEGRSDLGNTQPGDGVKYKGRGLIQITGRANYIALMMALNIDCVINPQVVEQPINACRSAGWFWKTNGLNEIADTGDFIHVTKVINGGTNGLADRESFFNTAKIVLGA
jgi:putative chitinase